MRRIVVIGGGISGLAAARRLTGGDGTPAGEVTDVVVLEASDRLGGKIRTAPAGSPVELGPDQFLRRDPSAEALCGALGLGQDLVAPAARTAAVFAEDKPRELPNGLVLGVPTDLDALESSGIVGPDAIAFASSDRERSGEPFTEEALGLSDEATEQTESSAGEILRPRLGDEITDRLVDPLLGGINAGGVDRLSLGTTAPQLASALVGHADVIAPLAALAPPAAPGLAPPSPFLGLRGGLGRLVTALGRDLTSRGCELQLGTGALVIEESSGGRFRVVTSAGVLEADGIVVAVPGEPAAQLLGGVSATAGGLLRGVDYAGVVVATIRLPAGAASGFEGWTGVLVPRGERALVSAVSFLSSKWPWMGESDAKGEGEVVIRLSAGRYLDQRALQLPGSDLAERLLGELRHFTGISATPRSVELTRWERSFPQYAPGHRGRIAALQRSLARTPTIALAGAVLGGIGIPACVASGERAAAQILGAFGS